jgi:hypothetical protein
MNMKDFADALASKDLERYSRWFAEDMRLYTPVHEEPSVGRQAACQILPLVFSLLDDFHYPDVIEGSDTHALLFHATVEGVALEGIDYIRTNAQGQVTDFFVMVRPLKALTTLAKAIGARMRAAGAPPAPGEQP